jgi:iron complex outermembrane receptor protein
MTSLKEAPRGRNMFFLQALLAATSLSAPSALLAQNSPASDSEKPTETIIVVGQRDTPITVVPRGLSVSLGKADFEAVNAINVEDLMKYAPNFFVRKRFAGDDNAVVALRGANTVQSARSL